MFLLIKFSLKEFLDNYNSDKTLFVPESGMINKDCTVLGGKKAVIKVERQTKFKSLKKSNAETIPKTGNNSLKEINLLNVPGGTQGASLRG